MSVRTFRFGERLVSVLTGMRCSQCGKQFAQQGPKLRLAPLPELSFAGYAVPKRRAAVDGPPSALAAFWGRVWSFCSALLHGKLTVRVRIVRSPRPNYNILSAPLQPRLRA